MRNFHEKVTSLRRERQSFATATVVGRRASHELEPDHLLEEADLA